jgi:hypothetical protein
MTPRIAIDDQTLELVRREGELQVEDPHGIPLVVMTVDARHALHQVAYDDSEWTEEEMLAIAAQQLNDPEGWGAPGMEIYDQLYGDKSAHHGNDK